MSTITTTPTPTAGPASSLPPVITSSELDLAAQSGEPITIVDVRTPAEFEAVHIPGSYNVPLDQIAEHRAEFRGIGAPIVLVCRSGVRARQAESLLRAADVSRLHVLDGGVTAWDQAGRRVVRGRQAWSIERQVRAIAGGLVLIGVLGSLLLWQPLLYLALLVGAGLLFAGLTDTCMMGMLLMRLPYNRGATCDVAGILARVKTHAAER